MGDVSGLQNGTSGLNDERYIVLGLYKGKNLGYLLYVRIGHLYVTFILVIDGHYLAHPHITFGITG